MQRWNAEALISLSALIFSSPAVPTEELQRFLYITANVAATEKRLAGESGILLRTVGTNK